MGPPLIDPLRLIGAKDYRDRKVTDRNFAPQVAADVVEEVRSPDDGSSQTPYWSFVGSARRITTVPLKPIISSLRHYDAGIGFASPRRNRVIRVAKAMKSHRLSVCRTTTICFDG